MCVYINFCNPVFKLEKDEEIQIKIIYFFKFKFRKLKIWFFAYDFVNLYLLEFF